MNKDKLEKGVEMILDGLGVDKRLEAFEETPRRVAKSLMELCSGLDADLEKEVFKGVFQAPTIKGQIPTAINNIHAWGICPHHLLPVILKVDVMYIPYGKVLGLSKVHRLVQVLSHRPVLQEELTSDIANIMHERLKCGVQVRVAGTHMCMGARGDKSSPDEQVITEAVVGNISA